MTEKSCRLMVSDYYERAGPLKGFTPTPSTRAHDKCQNRFYVILIDQFFTASRQHVHGRPLEQVEKKYIETELGTRDSIRYAGPPSDAIMDEDEMLSWL